MSYKYAGDLNYGLSVVQQTFSNTTGSFDSLEGFLALPVDITTAPTLLRRINSLTVTEVGGYEGVINCQINGSGFFFVVSELPATTDFTDVPITNQLTGPEVPGTTETISQSVEYFGIEGLPATIDLQLAFNINFYE